MRGYASLKSRPPLGDGRSCLHKAVSACARPELALALGEAASPNALSASLRYDIKPSMTIEVRMGIATVAMLCLRLKQALPATFSSVHSGNATAQSSRHPLAMTIIPNQNELAALENVPMQQAASTGAARAHRVRRRAARRIRGGQADHTRGISPGRKDLHPAYSRPLKTPRYSRGRRS